MSFEFKMLDLKEVVLVTPKVFADERGFFLESYKQSNFVSNGIEVEFVQDNHSKSRKNVLRGLHYQKNPKPQAKLVRCVKGTIFDVAVDIRVSSDTFGKWVGEILSDENQKMLYIPEGFAHGFYVLSDDAEVVYKTSCEYDSALDAGIVWNDATLAVNWNIKYEPILSDKDANLPSLTELKEKGALL